MFRRHSRTRLSRAYGRRGIVTRSLVDVGYELPVVIQFVERSEKVAEVMPTLRRMADTRSITLQEAQVVPADPLI